MKSFSAILIFFLVAVAVSLNLNVQKEANEESILDKIEVNNFSNSVKNKKIRSNYYNKISVLLC